MMKSRRIILIVLAVAMAATLAGCGKKTTIDHAWRNPEAPPLQFDKVLIVAFFGNDSQERFIEDRLAGHVTSAEAIPAYRVFSRDHRDDVEAAKAKVREMGIDGAITMRLAGFDTEIEETRGGYYYAAPYAPMPYYPFWGYYSYAWPVAYSPGSVDMKKVYRVETNIYSLEDEKLIWSGVTKSVNPDSVQQAVDDIAAAIGNVLRQQKLLP